jgi:hypothetical protein
MAGAIQETLERLSEEKPEEQLLLRRYLFLQDVLACFPTEFIVRQVAGESPEDFASRALWSAQEFGLELDAFFPYHRDHSDYTKVLG